MTGVNKEQCYYFVMYCLRDQDRVAVKRPHPNQEDVGLNPTTTRKEKWTLLVFPTPTHRRWPSGPGRI